jgi:hypothetical protein
VPIPGLDNARTNQEHSCTAPIRRMGRRRRLGNCTPQMNNSIKNLVGNEENEYQFLTPTGQ